MAASFGNVENSASSGKAAILSGLQFCVSFSQIRQQQLKQNQEEKEWKSKQKGEERLR